MIGLDTNVLLRLYLADEPEQAQSAKTLFASLSEDEPGYINVVTLVEFVWTLQRRFRIGRERITEIITGLLETRDILFEDEELLEVAMETAVASNRDIPDVLIALRNRRAGCRVTMTFDRKAVSRIPGMELLS